MPTNFVEPPPIALPHGTRPPPKTKPGDRIITIGAYGAFASATSNFMKIANDIYNSNYTGIVVFLDNEWCQVPGREYWPYPFANGKFDMSKDNPVFYQRLDDLLTAFDWYGLDIIFCFDSQYFTMNWVKMMRSKIHPYRQNTFNVNWGSCAKPLDCQKKIYDSWQAPSTFWWLKWVSVNESQNKFIFSNVGQFGAAKQRAVQKIMDVITTKKKASPNKNWRIGWKRANEEQARVDPTDPTKTSHALSLGDRSEIYAYMWDQWVLRVMKPNNKNFFAFVNRNLVGGTVPQEQALWRELHSSITRPYGQRYGMGALHEIHIEGIVDRDYLISKCGVNSLNTFWSTDGMKKINAKQYVADNRALYLKNDPYIDILYEEGVWGSTPASPDQFQSNWDKYFPFHKPIVK